MNELAAKGKSRTNWIFLIMLMISVNVIIDYQMALDSIDGRKLFQQVIRFLLTGMLMYFILKAKQWAVTVMAVLCGLGIILGLFSLGASVPLVNKIPAIFLILVYSLCIYHLNIAKSFKEYFWHLKSQE